MALSQAVKASINAEMTRQGFSQRRLARELGMSQQYVWRRVSEAPEADKEFTPSELEQVAVVLRVPIARLLRTAAAAA